MQKGGNGRKVEMEMEGHCEGRRVADGDTCGGGGGIVREVGDVLVGREDQNVQGMSVGEEENMQDRGCVNE